MSSKAAIEAGKASISLSLDDKDLRQQMAQVGRTLDESMGSMSGNLRGMDAIGKALGMANKEAGALFGAIARGLGPAVGMVDKFAASLGSATAQAKALNFAIKGVGIAGTAAAAGLIGYEIADTIATWIRSYNKLAEELKNLPKWGEEMAQQQDALAKKQELQIQRLKQMLAVEKLTNAEREKALAIVKELGAEGQIRVEGGRLVAEKGAMERLSQQPDTERLWGQEALVQNLRENYERQVKAAMGKVGTWDTLANPFTGTLDALLEAGKMATETGKRLEAEEKKLAEMREKTSAEALAKLAAEEAKLFAARKKNEEQIGKLQSEAAGLNYSPVQKQLMALDERRGREMGQLRANNATDEQVQAANAAFDQLAQAIIDAAKKAAADAEKMRMETMAKVEQDVARARAQSAETAQLNLAKLQGSEATKQALDALAAKYQEGAVTGESRLKDLSIRMSETAMGTPEYKALEDEWKKTIEQWTNDAQRFAELQKERNDLLQQEVARAAQYAKDQENYWEKLDAQTAQAQSQNAIDEVANAAKSAGDAEALRQLAEAARQAADAARLAQIEHENLALADGALTEEEGALLEALKQHATQQERQAQALAASAKEVERAGRQVGGGAGGFDAGAAIAKAMAGAMRNDQSVEYQRDTARATKELVELEKKRRETIVTFS